MEVVTVLRVYFDKGFDFGMHPTMWSKAVNTPIPKGSDKNPYLPLSYRHMSLLSCISKVYASILNERIVTYCEDRELGADKQNGFSKRRSCIDHIFNLTSLV